MRKITRDIKAASAAENWEEIQNRFGIKSQRNLEILAKLKSLGENPDPDEVDSIIGNSSWTDTECSLCHAINVPIIRFEANNNESIDLYEDCLKRALSLF